MRELTGLVEGANNLLAGSKGLETKYLSLPSYASQRLSLALEADPNAVRLPVDGPLHCSLYKTWHKTVRFPLNLAMTWVPCMSTSILCWLRST